MNLYNTKIFRGSVFLVALLLAACGSGGGGGAAPPGGSTPTAATLRLIAVSPANTSLGIGATQGYTATGTYSDGTTKDISALATWASSTASVASISASGVVAALTVGSTNISAALNGITGSTPLAVTTAVLQSVAVAPSSQSLGIGATQGYTATGTYSDGTTRNVTASAAWASSTASVASISASGVAAALTIGSTNISATVGGKTGTTPLTVTAKTVKSIAVTPAYVSINTGATQQLQAMATYSDGSTADVTTTATWATTNATIATVSTTGLVTGVAAQNGLAITATFGGAKGTGVVSVTLPANALTSLTVSPQAMLVGQSFSLLAVSANYANGTSSAPYTYVSWTSSNPAVATVDSQGVWTAISAGTTTMTVTSGNLSAFNTLTVTAPTLNSITVSPATPTIGKGSTLQMAAMGLYSDGTLKNITSSVTWSSSNAAAVTVNTAGLASGAASGSATISAVSGLVTGSTIATVPATAVTPTTVTLPVIWDNTISMSSTNAAWQTSTYPVDAFHPTSIAVGCNWTLLYDPIAMMQIQNFGCAQSLVKFNLAAIPAGKTITSAVLQLQTNIYGVGSWPSPWFVQALASSWSGTSVTWNSASNFLHYTASYSTYAPPTYSGQIFNIDQTNTVQSWYAGTYANNGFEFGITNYLFPYLISFDAFEFYSSEDTGGRGPRLVVTYQ